MNNETPKQSFLLELRSLSRSFGVIPQDIRPVDCIDFALNKGDFVSIMGPSGSGKSSLLAIMGLLDDGYTGELLLEEEGVHTINKAERAALRLRSIGFVFQHANLIPTLTVIENVMLPGRMAGMTNDEARRRALELLSYVGLIQKTNAKPSTLSAGERQRTSIARALVNRPALLLADEPTGSLDSNATKEIVELFSRMNHDDGITIVLTTHNPYVADTATRKFRMADGRLKKLEILNLRQEIELLFSQAKRKNTNDYKKVFAYPFALEKIAKDTAASLKGVSNLLSVLIRQRYHDVQDKYFLDRLSVLLQNQFIDAPVWHGIVDALIGIFQQEPITRERIEAYRGRELSESLHILRDRIRAHGFYKLADSFNINTQLYKAIVHADYYLEKQTLQYRDASGAMQTVDIDDVKERIAQYLDMLEKLIDFFLEEVNS